VRCWNVMNIRFRNSLLALTLPTLINSLAFAKEISLVEFESRESDSLGWRVVNDGVMGGLSKGQIKVSKDGILTFSGNLSLENNGGFSSMRTEKLEMNLSQAEGLVARVRGDGRTYQMRLSTDAQFRGMEVSFKADFKTKKGEWTEIKVPFEHFKGSFRGMSLSKEKFDSSKIRRVGLLLGDKKAGPFELQVDWIRTYGSKSYGTDVISTALADSRFGILASALTEADLVSTLQGEGPFTVFAPTDEAFKKLSKGTLENLLKPENKEQLQAVLSYHVISGKVDLAGALSAREAKTVEGSTVQITFNDGRVRVNNATIVNADVGCSNGIIHVIDTVILPPKPANDIASVAKRAGNFKTLLAAVKAAGLLDVFTGDQPVTVLAPTDEAFAKLPEGTVEELLKPENKDRLISILSLHAVSGKVSAGDALNAVSAQSLNGSSLEFGIFDATLKVNGTNIIKTDIECENGIIHVIDAVLLPSSIGEKDKTTSTSDLSPRRQIEAAIKQGVPVFNHGNHDECARIYRDCMVSISNSPKVEPRVAQILKELVKRAEKIESATERAWLLRSGLDSMHATLAGS